MDNDLFPITKQQVQAIMLEAHPSDVEKYTPYMNLLFPSYCIDTPLRAAHFLAQIAHESGCLRYSEELASGAAYEGRATLGNTEPGDGVRFKGRGLIQLTGRHNYQLFANFTRRPEILDNPAIVAKEPDLAMLCATWYWHRFAVYKLADIDDVIRVTKAINGGTNHLSRRRILLVRAKQALGDGK